MTAADPTGPVAGPAAVPVAGEDAGAVCPGAAPVDTAALSDGAPSDGAAGPGPYADCVRCGEPTGHPAAEPGTPLCALCTWQQAQRTACSG
ncbi:hypothetical protein LO771_18395 [Streptacidiphilus sp. ASG 303]|uniref:hypothetical protein n=1 Tax=Streptacidiphilus sp. ASG 303 TaxID=2896847 RepID=UPI001E52B69F|nr:hypothetical protein [Streptacidiphilus sp. ASG 303]MCD0484311.1 hypothetical protein [Streptacidiphilus sp. ASG 303]